MYKITERFLEDNDFAYLSDDDGIPTYALDFERMSVEVMFMKNGNVEIVVWDNSLSCVHASAVIVSEESLLGWLEVVAELEEE